MNIDHFVSFQYLICIFFQSIFFHCPWSQGMLEGAILFVVFVRFVSSQLCLYILYSHSYKLCMYCVCNSGQLYFSILYLTKCKEKCEASGSPGFLLQIGGGEKSLECKSTTRSLSSSLSVTTSSFTIFFCQHLLRSLKLFIGIDH